ncbi:PREDICTED: cas scaffolding protein family member 4 [Nanorana parkeri]|uniref:cas scaffolding protein family member 4 n=1 Tax=Nanorana parkeri TaxID=125878 RepID=UPI0008548DC4|nr:PREDICTED: cas scaffolding protein family member 4 [Nanorana parkeri]
MLAKALYDNKAECSDELAFRKGDILTVLEQNVFGSEGWWRCYLHGRQGLAPANRLQLFTIPQNDSLLAHSTYNSLGRQQTQQNIYQVPSAPKTEGGSMYEQMGNLYITPTTPKTPPGDIYQTPLSSPAQIIYDKANSSSNQHLFTLPRASKASSISKTEVYDVPPSKLNTTPSTQRGRTPSPINGRSPFLLAMEQSQQQQIYDIPSSPDTPEKSNPKASKASIVYDIPPTGALVQTNRSDTPPVAFQYSTLPNPRKSDWIYDIPLSPERNILKPNGRKISMDRNMVYDVPPTRYGPVHSKTESSSPTNQIYDVPPNKSIAASQCLYDIPASRDTSPLYQNGSLQKGSSSFGKPKTEKIDSKENVYDIPRGSAVGSPPKLEVSSPVCSDQIYDVPPPLPKDNKPSLHQPQYDRLSVSSSESRTSTLSTSSTNSSESVTFSTSEDSSSEVILELEVVIKNITELQERVSSSIASLMIFVSSKWRLQGNMESNLEDIHRAVNSIISSLRQFIDFARTIKASTAHLTDVNIQLRINNQLQTLSDSFLTLSKNQESINLCNWSLEALVMDKPRTAPDDLDQFVMVARTIPEDIKRFVSIIIANGKLLFKKQEEKRPKSEKGYTLSRKPQVPTRPDTKVLQEFCINRSEEQGKDKKYQLPKQKSVEDSGYVYLQKKEDFENMQQLSSMQQLERKTSPEEKRKGWLKPDSRIYTSEDPTEKSVTRLSKAPPVPPNKPDILQKHDSVKKLALSNQCYLYFGALQKAIRVFGDSLSKQETPEVFITHGKLIIMVGQKLVDMLCQDVRVGEARNDVLYKSSELCGLLKSLALATKTAAIQYPNTAAMLELQHRTAELSNHTQLFRSMLE